MTEPANAGVAWRVRTGEVSDVDAVLALERQVADAPHWPRHAYMEIFAGNVGDQAREIRRCLWVAGEGAELLGFAVGSVCGSAREVGGPGEVQGELESVAVALTAQQRGIGRALCLAVVAWCEHLDASKVLLEVRSRSVSALRLYRRLGFVDAGVRLRYYSGPQDDALLMQLDCQPQR